MVRSPSIGEVGRGAVLEADAFDGDFHRVGRDLAEHGFHPLADGRGSDRHDDHPVGGDRDLGVFARTRGAAFDETSDREAVVAAIDEAALQRLLLVPPRRVEAAVEKGLVGPAVERRRIGGG